MAKPGATPPLAPSHRPAPVPASKSKTIIIPADKFAPVIGLAFNMAARLRGPHWAAEADEIAALSVALADIAVYIPLPQTELGITLALSNLGTTLFMVLWPRIQADAELRAQAAAVAEAERAVRQSQSGMAGGTEGEGPRLW